MCSRALHTLRRQLSSGAQAFTTSFPHGLTCPGATDAFYTTALDLSQPLLLRGSGDFMAAARADARARLQLKSTRFSPKVEASVREHLASAAARCGSLKHRGEVHACEGTRGALQGCLQQTGQLALLLGGKNTGKSLLLSRLAAQQHGLVGAGGMRRAVLYVDARVCGTDLAAGMLEALDEGLLQKVLWQEGCAAGRAPQTASQRTLAVLMRVLAAHQAAGLYLCLVVDETRLALTGVQGELLGDAEPLLQRLLLLTQQSRAMNVLLVATEHNFPARLSQGGILPSSSLSDIIIASEVPPASMRQLLLQQWGLGPRLSDVLLAYCGGHVHTAGRALAKLSVQLDCFRVQELAPLGAAEDITRCLEGAQQQGPAAAAGGDCMLRVLRELAERGFAPVAHEGRASVQAIESACLGGMVCASAIAPGLPREVRGVGRGGLVPASHFMRHLIAEALYTWGRRGGGGASGSAASPLLLNT